MAFRNGGSKTPYTDPLVEAKFQNPNKDREIHERYVTRDAQDEGLRGNALKQRVKERMDRYDRRPSDKFKWEWNISRR
jgi:hypothetical protein